MCATTHSILMCPDIINNNLRRAAFTHLPQHVHSSHDTSNLFIHVTCFIHTCGTTQSHMCQNIIQVTRLIHTCTTTHQIHVYTWYGAFTYVPRHIQSVCATTIWCYFVTCHIHTCDMKQSHISHNIIHVPHSHMYYDTSIYSYTWHSSFAHVPRQSHPYVPWHIHHQCVTCRLHHVCVTCRIHN